MLKIGEKFNRWTVIADAGLVKGAHKWLCKCDCGTEKSVYEGHLKNGASASCGCYHHDLTRALFSKHGMKDSRQYSIWATMKNRCNNPNYYAYRDYGGRGIKVCERWNDFKLFWEDMKEGYADHLTLDRIENEDDYHKDNCRWATQKEQQNNRRNNIILETPKGPLTISETAEEFGINRRALVYQLQQGKPIDEILRALSK